MNVRKLMGIGSYTTSGRGMTSYCMSDGRTHCTSEDYKTVETNLTTKLGPPQSTDDVGARYWYVERLGLIILPAYVNRIPFMYVELDKSCTRDYFEREVMGRRQEVSK